MIHISDNRALESNELSMRHWTGRWQRDWGVGAQHYRVSATSRSPTAPIEWPIWVR